MGKKRITTDKKTEGVKKDAAQEPAVAVAGKNKRRSIEGPTLHVDATYNNTKAMLSDKKGNAIIWSSAGTLGFKGAKKGTPFAAAKLGEVLAEKALELGIKEIDVIIRGVGSGRESAVRSFIAKGLSVNTIKDVTPVPHNGPKPKKPRRV
ncbi:MAG TPA: 30S ribosomal protein S11 [Candidatus Paceibacterota bacterium]|nr:30S ribosomal protein S11 [Candidatus Paceibacterota bacterium]